MCKYRIIFIFIIFIINSVVYSKNDTLVYNNEIIIKFKQNFLKEEFKFNFKKSFDLDSTLKFEKIKKYEIKLVKQLIKNDFEIRKLLNRKERKDTVSISRTGQRIRISDVHDICILKFDKKKMNILDFCDSLSDLSFVEYAVPNYLVELLSSPNDTYYSNQKSLEQSNDIDIDIERAWDFTTGNYGVKVAVVDYGIDYDHIDLGDGDFGNSGDKIRGGWDYVNNDSDPDHDYTYYFDHGTAVAGVIGALRNNSQGVSGISGGNGSSSIGSQIFSLKTGPYNGSGLKTSAIIEAIIDASDGYDCNIINGSFGSYSYNEAVRDAVRIAAENGVVFVAGTGNDNLNSILYPARYDDNWVIAVGGTDEYDERHDDPSDPNYKGSNYGYGIDVVAPSVTEVVHTTLSGGYSSWFGTSSAAPHVSGLSALILSEALEQSITLHPNDVEGIICSSAEDVNNSSNPGYDIYLGHGRINAGQALEMMNKPWKMNYHSNTGGTIVSTTSWYNLTVYNSNGPLSPDTYEVKRSEVHKVVTLPNYLNTPYVWTRSVNESIGWSDKDKNYQLGYSDIYARNGSSVTFTTFIYEVKKNGVNLGYYPTTYDNVVYKYTTLGIPCYDDVHLVETFRKNLDNNTTLISASNNITASNIIESNADVHYKAGTSIRLWPGVHIKMDSEFRANIDECEETTYSKINLTKSKEYFEYKNSSNLKLAPNPTSGNAIAIVEVEEKSICSLTLLDNLGNEVITIFKDKELDPGKYQYDLEANNLSNGIYLCVLRIGSSMHSEKLVYLK